jgi:uncharacterized membrane protein
MNLFQKKEFFPKKDNEMVVQAIRDAEKETSGEIRVFVESKCRYSEPLHRAKEIFSHLKMEKTRHRNGVLFYIAVKDRQLAIYADKGIHQAIGEEYWKNVVNHILEFFNKENYALGIKECVLKIGEALRSHFPYDAATDKNDLPDEIIFGR